MVLREGCEASAAPPPYTYVGVLQWTDFRLRSSATIQLFAAQDYGPPDAQPVQLHQPLLDHLMRMLYQAGVQCDITTDGFTFNIAARRALQRLDAVVMNLLIGMVSRHPVDGGAILWYCWSPAHQRFYNPLLGPPDHTNQQPL